MTKGYSWFVHVLLFPRRIGIKSKSIIYIVGYNLICAAEGFKFDVWINPFGGCSTCYGNPENLLAYSITGPVFGAMAAWAPLAISKIRHSKT
jgi:hypothetical protein